MKAKVLMIGPTPPPPGGVAIVMQALLDSRLHEVYNLSVLDTSRKRRRYKPVGILKCLSILYLIRNLARLNYLLYREKPSIIHVQSSTSGFPRDSFFIMVGKLWRKKIVCHLHGFYSKKHIVFRYGVSNHYSRFILKCVDILVLLSRSFVPEFDSFAPKTVKTVIPNFLSQSFSEEFRYSETSVTLEVRILYVGRLSQKKGTYDLLAAASLLQQEENIRFFLAGLGETEADEEKVISQIKERGLENKVKMLGYVSGQEKIELFKSCDIFVLPSYTEIFPVVILEAMAFGMPVVATPVGAVPDIIKNDVNGFTVRPGDSLLLADTIYCLAANPEKRIEIGQNNRKKFEREYRTEINIDKIDMIYQSLLRDHSK